MYIPRSQKSRLRSLLHYVIHFLKFRKTNVTFEVLTLNLTVGLMHYEELDLHFCSFKLSMFEGLFMLERLRAQSFEPSCWLGAP